MMPHSSPLNQARTVLFHIASRLTNFKESFCFTLLNCYNCNHCSSWRACCVHLTYKTTVILFVTRETRDGGIHILTLKIRQLMAGELNSFPYLPQVCLTPKLAMGHCLFSSQTTLRPPCHLNCIQTHKCLL